jgi:HEAT repeat protein
MSKWLLIVAAVLLVLTVGVYGFLYLGDSRSSALAALEKQALSASTPELKEQAALALADRGKEAVEAMRRVLSQSDLPAVRAVMIQALGAAYDFDSMPKLIEGLDDPAPGVRAKAGVAVSKILGMEFVNEGSEGPLRKINFADDPAEVRAEGVRKIRAAYEIMLKNPPPRYRRK